MRIVLAPVSLLIVFVCTIAVISQASGSAESEIQSVMAEARNASLEGDSAKIAALMTDDYLQTDISGHVQDKATWFKEYFNPSLS
jgi:hypothetical protein